MKNKFKDNISWIYFVSKRINKVDRKGRTAVTSKLASLGVCFGVMALITVMSVMNGFQRSYIDSIMEISSFHTRVSNINPEQKEEFESFCANQKIIRSVIPFYEAQGLMTYSGIRTKGEQSAVIVRAVPSDICKDKMFEKELNVFSGDFDLSEPDSIIIGNSLAKKLGARVGGKINIAALSGSSDVALLSQNRVFTVKGIFYSGYADINSTYAFININEAEKYFGKTSPRYYGIKFNHSRQDSVFQSLMKINFPEAKSVSYKEYNKSFFGALRMEKNMLFIMVFLIFIVVAINIYNGMKKLVYERKTEIAVLKSLGASSGDVQNVFIIQGFLTGVTGAVPGLFLGLFLSVNIEKVFMLLSKVQYFAQVAVCSLINPASVNHIRENSMFAVYARIPARIIPSEVLVIFLFGILSALLASTIASSDVLKMSITEVLRDE